MTSRFDPSSALAKPSTHEHAAFGRHGPSLTSHASSILDVDFYSPSSIDSNSQCCENLRIHSLRVTVAVWNPQMNPTSLLHSLNKRGPYTCA
jgi:hypothetical protein